MTNLIYSCIYYNVNKDKRTTIVMALSLVVMLSILSLGFIVAGYTNNIEMVDQGSQLPATSSSILEAVNTERAKIGVAPLIMNERITKSAQLKADDMWARNYRSHYLPEDPTATLTPEMADLVNPVCSLSSENYVYDIGNGTTTTRQAMNWWMSSPPHKKAILDPKYTLTGIGVANDSIVVQHFCVAR